MHRTWTSATWTAQAVLKPCSWPQWKIQDGFEASGVSFMVWLWYCVRTRPGYTPASLLLLSCIVLWFPLEENRDIGTREEAHSDQVLDLGDQDNAAHCLAQPRHSLEDYKAIGWSWSTRNSRHVICTSPLPRLIGEEKLLSFLNSSEFLQHLSPFGTVWPFTQLRKEPRAEMQVNTGLDCEMSTDRLQQGIAWQLSKA